MAGKITREHRLPPLGMLGSIREELEEHLRFYEIHPDITRLVIRAINEAAENVLIHGEHGDEDGGSLKYALSETEIEVWVHTSKGHFNLEEARQQSRRSFSKKSAGYGLIETIMDDIKYEVEGKGNCVYMKKSFQPQPVEGK